MRHTSSALLVLLGVFLAAIVVVGEMGPIEHGGAVLQDNPIPPTEESVRAGNVVYRRFCRSCHGVEGKGDGGGAPPGSKPANLVDDEWDYGGTDAEISKTIQEGIPPDLIMAAWEGRISDEDIWNLINYMRDLAERANEQ